MPTSWQLWQSKTRDGKQGSTTLPSEEPISAPSAGVHHRRHEQGCWDQQDGQEWWRQGQKRTSKYRGHGGGAGELGETDRAAWEESDLEPGSLASEEYQSKAEVVEGCGVVEDLADVRRSECISGWLDPGRRRRCWGTFQKRFSGFCPLRGGTPPFR